MSKELKGKRAIITAGADGIGRAIARSFLDAGALVHICDVDEEKLAKFQAPNLSATLADVANEAQVERLFDEAEAALGGLDILVNNAGIAGPTGPIETLESEDWRRCIEVNLIGQFYCIKLAVPKLRAAGGGSIVNLSSTAGIMGFANRSPYAASKWAVTGLTKSLAIELGPDHIRVNAICPGAVAGERIDRVIVADAGVRGLDPETVRAEYARSMSLGVFIDPEDIAAMALFVCSDAGAKVSGQALAVDGNTESLGG